MIDATSINWEKVEGLVPAIVQDAADGSVLMLGYMNRESLAITLEKGLVTFYSRSRKSLWTKGESSGHVLHCLGIRLDCDADTLLISARPEGPTCHTGTETCWGERRPAPLYFEQLEQIIEQRHAHPSQASYTSELFASGTKRMAQKVGEEGVEVALAAMEEATAPLLDEAADLVFHLMVLLRSKGLHLRDVSDVLAARHQSRQQALKS